MKKIILFIIAVGLIVAGALFLMPGRQEYQYQPNSNQNTSGQAASQSNSSAASNTPADGWEVAPNAALAACMSDLNDQMKKSGIDYEQGTILVSFNAGTSMSDANIILAPYDLSVDPAKKNNFSGASWGTVAVAKGKEVETVCKLQTDPKIRHVTLNTILDLHE